MEQGKLDQAEQILRRLLSESPDDPRLTAGLADVQRRREGALAGGETDDHVSLHAAEAGELTCRWRVTDEGRARAALVLGEDGRLVLRVVAFPIGPKSRPTDLELTTASGEAVITPPRGASLVGAAVGLLGEGEFVSITHCRPIGLGG